MALVITKNFYKAMHHGLSGTSYPTVYNNIFGLSDNKRVVTIFSYKNSINADYSQSFYFNNYVWKGPAIDPFNSGNLSDFHCPMSILFGTGETQPTFDDYKMENGFFNPNAIKYTTFIKKMPIDFDALLMFSTTVKNVKAEGNIEIKEIGFVMGTSNSTAEPIYLESAMTIDGDLAIDTTGRYILLAREVLETPVVLAPDESRTFEIAIKF